MYVPMVNVVLTALRSSLLRLTVTTLFFRSEDLSFDPSYVYNDIEALVSSRYRKTDDTSHVYFLVFCSFLFILLENNKTNFSQTESPRCFALAANGKIAVTPFANAHKKITARIFFSRLRFLYLHLFFFLSECVLSNWSRCFLNVRLVFLNCSRMSINFHVPYLCHYQILETAKDERTVYLCHFLTLIVPQTGVSCACVFLCLWVDFFPPAQYTFYRCHISSVLVSSTSANWSMKRSVSQLIMRSVPQVDRSSIVQSGH